MAKSKKWTMADVEARFGKQDIPKPTAVTKQFESALIIRLEIKYPTLNEYILVERSDKLAAASLKKKYTKNTHSIALQYKDKIDPTKAYHFTFVWHTTTKSDPDNLTFGTKFILDGFVKANIVNQDTNKHVLSISHEYEYNSKSDFVTVLISETRNNCIECGKPLQLHYCSIECANKSASKDTNLF